MIKLNVLELELELEEELKLEEEEEEEEEEPPCLQLQFSVHRTIINDDS